MLISCLYVGFYSFFILYMYVTVLCVTWSFNYLPKGLIKLSKSKYTTVFIHCKNKLFHCVRIFVIFPLFVHSLNSCHAFFHARFRNFTKLKSRSYNKYSHSINKLFFFFLRKHTHTHTHTKPSHSYNQNKDACHFVEQTIFSACLISITRHCNTCHKIRRRIYFFF